MAADDLHSALAALEREIQDCTRCALHATRTNAVPGEGDPDSDLLLVGEAPGYHEDQQGRPFVGQAGKLLEELLASIGLTRKQVFIANVLKSRPPNNRDPLPDEIAACQQYLWRQIGLIKPKVICTLGNHATKLLTGNPAGITRVHGRPQDFEIGGQALYLYPIFHPAAALYTRAMLVTLQEDFARLPDLLARPRPRLVAGASPPAAPGGSDGAPSAPAAAPPSGGAAPESAPSTGSETGGPEEHPAVPAEAEQLGLF